MKLALINPPFLFPSKREIVFSQCLGLRSLSSYLKENGDHTIHFIDALMLGFENVKSYANGYIVGLELDDIISRIPLDTELIGVSAPFSQLAPIVHEVVAKAKNSFPEAVMVMGGVYPSTQPELALTSEADVIVVGEGEKALSGLAGGISPSKIQGVYSRNALSLPEHSFARAEMIEDIDTLPFLDYSIPFMDKYFSISQRMKEGRTASLITSRGCPFSCEFCSISPIYGRKYRQRSAANVLKEIKYLVDIYAIRHLEIEDDNFTLNKERTVKILEGLIALNERGAGLSWSTPNGVRIDTLDEQIIKLIKQSNCSSITLALEHGDQEMLKIMNKKLNLETAYNVIKMLVKHGIPLIGLFVIVGYPGETRERFNNSLTYLKKLRKLGKNVTIFSNVQKLWHGSDERQFFKSRN